MITVGYSNKGPSNTEVMELKAQLEKARSRISFFEDYFEESNLAIKKADVEGLQNRITELNSDISAMKMVLTELPSTAVCKVCGRHKPFTPCEYKETCLAPYYSMFMSKVFSG